MGTWPEDSHKIRTECSEAVPGPGTDVPHREIGKKENPGALAGATGVAFEVGNFKDKAYAKKKKTAMSLFAKDAHKRASRVLGYALTLDDRAGWSAAAVVWAARLTVGERAALALAALSSLDPDEAAFVANLALGYAPETEAAL